MNSTDTVDELANDRVANPIAALSAADHSQGETHAALTLLQYGDYECPACARAEPVTRGLVETHGAQMRFVFRHFPLMALHPHAVLAAEAAEAAAAQGRFWAMHHRLFMPPHHLALPALTAHAEAIGLDMIRFGAEMADRIYTQRVQEHRSAGMHGGVRETPTFFLNGRVVDVASGLEALEAAIQVALKGRDSAGPRP